MRKVFISRFSVNAVRVMPMNPNQVVTGTAEGWVQVLNCSTGQPIISEKLGQKYSDLQGVEVRPPAAQPAALLGAAAASPRRQPSPPPRTQVTALETDSTGVVIFAGSADGAVQCLACDMAARSMHGMDRHRPFRRATAVTGITFLPCSASSQVRLPGSAAARPAALCRGVRVGVGAAA